MVMLVLIAGLALITGSRLSSGFIPEEDQGYLYLNVQLPNASSLQRTDAVCRRIEQISPAQADQKGQQDWSEHVQADQEEE